MAKNTDEPADETPETAKGAAVEGTAAEDAPAELRNSTVRSWETFPMLAADPEFINDMGRARQLKSEIDTKEAELKRLVTKLGPRIAVAGASSVNFLGLLLINSRGSDTPGDILIPNLRDALNAYYNDSVRVAIVLSNAAVAVDAKLLVNLGVPSHIIADARGQRKIVKGSTQLRWTPESNPVPKEDRKKK